MMGHHLNVMTQAPYPEDKADLPNGLYIMRTYTELKDGSCSVSVVLQNLTAQPIHLARGCVVGWVVTANAVPEAQCSPDLLKKLDDEDLDKPEPVKLTISQRQDLLKKDGGLDHLKEWPPELAQKAVALLEFHHIFSLELNEISCTDTTEHVIELMKDEPFKERFRRITPPLVDEICQHIQEMLDSGAIQPSQSPWCNAVVLVRKKDGSLRFCIDFRHLNTKPKRMPIMQAQMLAETKKNYQNLADSHWVVAQQGDIAIQLVMDWLKRKKDDHQTLDQYLKHHVPDAEHRIYAARQKDFVLRRNLLYLRVMPKRSSEDVLVFVVPGLKRQVVIDGCH